ncbi:hypothetical protein NDU88_011002 [Pleurodeles waltl]|uniref:Uncharacterized protein n=1 Tax=Pleurodeles waltl TaxID=8319 RepID=A0AAV7S291_PLEWA|nr:hypothetical protein NDU88_011002 [Pleurodeles waltl]
MLRRQRRCAMVCLGCDKLPPSTSHRALRHIVAPEALPAHVTLFIALMILRALRYTLMKKAKLKLIEWNHWFITQDVVGAKVNLKITASVSEVDSPDPVRPSHACRLNLAVKQRNHVMLLCV